MLLLKYLLMLTGYGLLGWGLAIAFNNVKKVVQYHRQLRDVAPENQPEKPHLSWTTAKWALLGAWLPIILASGIVVVPSGMGGVRVSQTSGTRPGTLYPGVHFVTPLVDSVILYDTRDQVLTTSTSKAADKKAEPFTVQSREGLTIGLAITVRYKLDAKRLDFIHSNLPQPVEQEIVPPVVSSVFRELAPNYTVREVFATKREEIRTAAADRITKKLGADGIIVKEVMLRDIELPAEYARGLEGLLLKEQDCRTGSRSRQGAAGETGGGRGRGARLAGQVRR
jgi:regulator of protease activity HflC (stomatin/prohibitin superfamily)